ncbi:hypothetical protein [Providencia heimbachae]|nr:hypothetical protein [Providencia heimbachae]
MQLQPWVPGEQLLTDFDIKLGRLPASVKSKRGSRKEISVFRF